jgi:hypothetical protein
MFVSVVQQPDAFHLVASPKKFAGFCRRELLVLGNHLLLALNAAFRLLFLRLRCGLFYGPMVQRGG